MLIHCCHTAVLEVDAARIKTRQVCGHEGNISFKVAFNDAFLEN